jgi:hypothetical protein
MWQDFCILSLNLVFGFTLIPQVRELYTKKTSMSIASCSMTFSALIILGVTYATLGLLLAVCGNLLDLAAWGSLLGLSIIHRNRVKNANL